MRRRKVSADHASSEGHADGTERTGAGVSAHDCVDGRCARAGCGATLDLRRPAHRIGRRAARDEHRVGHGGQPKVVPFVRAAVPPVPGPGRPGHLQPAQHRLRPGPCGDERRQPAALDVRRAPASRLLDPAERPAELRPRPRKVLRRTRRRRGPTQGTAGGPERNSRRRGARGGDASRDGGVVGRGTGTRTTSASSCSRSTGAGRSCSTRARTA